MVRVLYLEQKSQRRTRKQTGLSRDAPALTEDEEEVAAPETAADASTQDDKAAEGDKQEPVAAEEGKTESTEPAAEEEKPAEEKPVATTITVGSQVPADIKISDQEVAFTARETLSELKCAVTGK